MTQDDFKSAERFISYYYQAKEVIYAKPEKVLEVGKGSSLLGAVLKSFYKYDYESRVPDCFESKAGSDLAMTNTEIFNSLSQDNKYDVVCCYEVLEYLPFADFEKAVSELLRVSRQTVVLSITDKTPMGIIFIDNNYHKIPCLGTLKEPRQDTSYKWEISKKYRLKDITKRLNKVGKKHGFRLENVYRPLPCPSKHYFVLKKLRVRHCEVAPCLTYEAILNSVNSNDQLSQKDIQDNFMSNFYDYMNPTRYASFYHQVHEINSRNPSNILEVGIGSGFLSFLLKNLLKYDYSSLDNNQYYNADYLGSVLDIPFPDNKFDIVCCFEVLEHLPFSFFEKALSELCRVAKKNVIISFPDRMPSLRFNFNEKIKTRLFRFPLANLIWKPKICEYHKWEMNLKGFATDSAIINLIKNIGGKYGFFLEKEYRPWDTPYNHFFILTKKGA
jgi:ubiquinone/menaquinone biosynthesis C-methylase UbiE